MANKFALLGCSGIIVSAVCLTAAGLLAGNALRGQNRAEWREDIRELFSSRSRCPALSGVAGTRQIPWEGGDEASVRLAGNVHYRPGDSDQVTITGDSALLDHVRVRDGNVRIDCGQRDGGKLDVTLPGRRFHTFSVMGTGDIDLSGIDQPSLELNVMGTGDIKADGRTEHLEVNVMGSGDADLAGLVVENAELNVMGSGDIDVSATERLELSMFGAGDVTLHREPRQIDQSMFGAGKIIRKLDADTPPAAPETPAPAGAATAPEAPAEPPKPPSGN
jgi:hypothetical protein